jgi:hypothetical protein
MRHLEGNVITCAGDRQVVVDLTEHKSDYAIFVSTRCKSSDIVRFVIIAKEASLPYPHSLKYLLLTSVEILLITFDCALKFISELYYLTRKRFK